MSDETPAVSPVGPAQSSAPGPITWLITAAIAAAVTAVGLAGAWAYYQRHKTPAFAVVNVQAVMGAREKSFAGLLRKGHGSQAYELATRMGPALDDALSELSKQCGCVLLVSQAVAGPGVPDLTARLNQIIDANIARPAPAASPAVQNGEPQ